jgi:hypothetical protein
MDNGHEMKRQEEVSLPICFGKMGKSLNQKSQNTVNH